MEITINIHEADWPEVEYLIGRKANERKYKDAQEVARLQERINKEIARESKKQLTYRRNLDRKNGINTIDEFIGEGQPNPLYKPL